MAWEPLPEIPPDIAASIDTHATDLYHDLMRRYRGRHYAQCIHHPDGSAVARIMGGYRFQRDTRGHLSLQHDSDPTRHHSFPLYHAPNSLTTHAIVTDLIKRDILEVLHERIDHAHPQHPLDTDPSVTPPNRTHDQYFAIRERIQRAAWRIGMSLCGYLDIPKRHAHLRQALQRLYDPRVFRLAHAHARLPGLYHSRTYNVLASFRDPERVPAFALSAYLATHPNALEPRELDSNDLQRSIREHLDLDDHAWVALARYPAASARALTIPLTRHSNNQQRQRAITHALARLTHPPRYSAAQYLARLTDHCDWLDPQHIEGFIEHANAITAATRARRGIRAYLATLHPLTRTSDPDPW